MTRISIDLQDDERDALVAIASDERRHPRQQAALLIRRQLESMGALSGQAAKSAPPAEAEGAR